MVGSPTEIKSVAMQEVKDMHKALQDLGHNNGLSLHAFTAVFSHLPSSQCDSAFI